MGWWNEQACPRLVHHTLDNPIVTSYRRQVCDGLEGAVMEIGFGSGLSLPHLPPEVRAVMAVEPSDVAWKLAADAIARCAVPVIRSGRDAQHLDLPDASVDSALSTFTLCTLPDAGRALDEMCRVLRPGGRLHFLEHGLAPGERVRRWQHRIEPANRAIAGGCHLTRSPAVLVEAAGLVLGDLQSGYLPVPAFGRPWSYLSGGCATKEA